MIQGQLSEQFGGKASEGFDREAVEATRRAELAEKSHHQLSVSGQARDAGVIDTNAGLGAQYLEEAKRKEEENRKTLDRAEMIAMLNARIGALDEAIAGYDQQLEKIDEAQDALSELEELYAKGDLDPDDLAHKVLMDKAGISQADLEKDPGEAFERQREYWDNEETRVLKKRGEAVRERERYEQGAERIAEASSDAEALEILNELDSQQQDFLTTKGSVTAENVEELDASQGFGEEFVEDALDALESDDAFGGSFANEVDGDNGVNFEPQLSQQFSVAANGDSVSASPGPSPDHNQALSVRP